MLRVGLTGGIASGKSTVAKGLARLGARVLDADEVAREVVLPGRPAWTKLREVFGSDFFQPDHSLNRNKLRRLIFTDPCPKGKDKVAARCAENIRPQTVYKAFLTEFKKWKAKR